RSTFDPQYPDQTDLDTLDRAARYALQNDQLVIWDCSVRPWAVATYNVASRQLQPLTDEEAANLLTRDAEVGRQWRKWSGMSQNHGSLIVLDVERVRKVLEAKTPTRAPSESSTPGRGRRTNDGD